MGPKPLQDPEFQKHATQILGNMLRQEEKELQRICEVYSWDPASLLEEQIEGARRCVTQLQLKIKQETDGFVDIPPHLVTPAREHQKASSLWTARRWTAAWMLGQNTSPPSVRH